MPTGIVTSKGQTTIPREIREHLNLRPGDKIAYSIEEGSVVMRAKNLHPSALRGILPPPDRALSIEEIDEGIRRAAAASDARSR
jgi:antitoxin PrlF